MGDGPSGMQCPPLGIIFKAHDGLKDSYFIYVCVVSTHVYACMDGCSHVCEFMCMFGYASACGGLRLTSGFFLSPSPPGSLRQDLSIKPKAYQLG